MTKGTWTCLRNAVTQRSAQELCHKNTFTLAARVAALIVLGGGGTRKDLDINVKASVTIGGIVCLSSSIIHLMTSNLPGGTWVCFFILQTCIFLEGKYTVSLISCLLAARISLLCSKSGTL